MGKINDLDLNRWKEYNDIISDSLWIINNRDSEGTHCGDYHGNFIPQIPYQMMRRYTKKEDWILDAFLGSGTTLIEAKRMGRNGIGIEIDSHILNIAKKRVFNSDGNGKSEFILGDSSEVDIRSVLNKNGIKKVQFIIYHPPYWDIILFNDEVGNLALETTLEGFINKFGDVVDNTQSYLEDEHYLAIVIGDIYKNSQWIPLNSYIIQLMIQKGFLLKSIIVKNMGETRAKQNKKAIWRYRSLANGFYVFAHEYILIFKKLKTRKHK